MSCSLALAASAIAQQPQEQASPGKEQGRKEAHQQQQQQQTTQQQSGRRQHGQKPAGQQNAAVQNNGTGQQNAAPANVEPTQKARGAGKDKRGRRGNAETNAAATNASPATNANANVTPGGKQARQGKRGRDRASETTNTGANAAATGAATTGSQTNTAANTQTNVNAGGRGARKLDQQKLQTIKSQHQNFRAEPRPNQVPAVTFNQNHRIEGAQQWQGARYEVFRSYHPEYHDQGWWHSHYTNIQLIGGGYYFFNNGYWYPAWGYDQSAQYYAWDGPIYVGHSAEPPDRVIADVQAALKEEGYYTGEVDGLLGPLTRQALSEYQAEHSLPRTAVIDEPTLDSLGMS